MNPEDEPDIPEQCPVCNADLPAEPVVFRRGRYWYAVCSLDCREEWERDYQAWRADSYAEA